MSFIAYFGIGMLVLVIVVLAGFLIARAHAADYFSPIKQANRSANAALKGANK